VQPISKTRALGHLGIFLFEGKKTSIACVGETKSQDIVFLGFIRTQKLPKVLNLRLCVS